MDAFGYLESCRYRYGLDAADFWNGLIGTIEPDTILKVRQAVEEREMKVVNYHVDGVHLWEDDPEARERNRVKAWEHLHVAASLGAKTVRFDTGGKLLALSEEQFDLLATRYREYCGFAADNGFRIGPENHWGLSLVADNMERLARAIDHPAYGILLHLGHWEDCDPVEGDRRLAPWTIHTHVDAGVTRTNLGERMQVLLDAGYKGYWGVEHHTAQNEYAEVAYQLAEVRRVLARKCWVRQDAETMTRREARTRNPLLTVEQEGQA